MRHVLVDARNGACVASDLELARSMWARSRGLLGRSGLPEGGGMRFDGTNSIHMLFMRFAIDVAYLDRDGRVLKVVHDLSPWRFSSHFRAKTTIELPAGTLRRHDVRVGDVLELRPAEVAA